MGSIPTLVRVFLCPCVSPFPSVGLTLTWFIWDWNLALHITLYSVNSIYKCSWEVEPGTTRIKFNEWSERVLNPGSPDVKASALTTTGPHCLLNYTVVQLLQLLQPLQPQCQIPVTPGTTVTRKDPEATAGEKENVLMCSKGIILILPKMSHPAAWSNTRYCGEDVTSATKKLLERAILSNDLHKRHREGKQDQRNMPAAGVFTETVVKNRMIEMDEQGFLYYQSTIIDYVDSLTFDEARECVGQDDEQSKTLTCTKSTWTRKREPYELVHVLRWLKSDNEDLRWALILLIVLRNSLAKWRNLIG